MANRRTLLGLGGWLAAAAVTTAATSWAVSLIGAGLTGPGARPMAPSEVEHALAGPPGGAVVQPPASLSPGAASRNFSYPEGSLVAACDGDQAVLRSWSPAQGYGADDAERGPAPTVSVEFESDDRGVVVEVTCRNGTPSATVRPGDESNNLP